MVNEEVRHWYQKVRTHTAGDVAFMHECSEHQMTLTLKTHI